MNTIKNFLKFLIILSLTVFFNTVFWSSWESIDEIWIIDDSKIELNSAHTWILNNTWEINDQNKTIKELNSEMKRLDKEIVTTNIKIHKLKSLNSISDFLRDDLNEEDIIKIKDITYTYNLHKEELEERLEKESNNLDEIEKLLIENKKEIYKELIPYIKKEKFKEYLEFIKNDLLILKETNQLKDSSIKKSILLKEKVDNIKGKIIEHKENISEKLRLLISEKIEEKVNEFKNSERFQNLETSQKEELVKQMIFKTDEMIEWLKEVEFKTTVLIQKIEIYTIIKEKLEIILLEI